MRAAAAMPASSSLLRPAFGRSCAAAGGAVNAPPSRATGACGEPTVSSLARAVSATGACSASNFAIEGVDEFAAASTVLSTGTDSPAFFGTNRGSRLRTVAVLRGNFTAAMVASLCSGRLLRTRALSNRTVQFDVDLVQNRGDIKIKLNRSVQICVKHSSGRWAGVMETEQN